MELKGIQEVLSIIQLHQIDEIQIIDGDRLYDSHILLHSQNRHALYPLCIQQDKIKRISDVIRKTFITPINFICIYRHGSSWKKTPVNSENVAEVFSDKNRVFLFFQPQQDEISLMDFQEQVAHLRAPEGCPWDREQTHRTLRTNLIEEAYEVLEAIDENDSDHLQEELGDLLLQIVLHAQIASEGRIFNLSNVIQGIYNKIKNRHPHVFKEKDVKGVKEVLENWETLKSEERNNKKHEGFDSILTSIPSRLPSLVIAQKYQERAARVGFDWKEIAPVYKKVEEEIAEIKNAKTKNNLEEELGDLLFAVVNLARWHGVDAESALRQTNAKFRQRFEFIEQSINNSGKSLSETSLSEMDALWNSAKKREHSENPDKDSIQ